MSKTKTLIYCSLFTALIAAGAFIKIPVPVVPFTLQYLFTMLAGLLLGSKRGTISVVAYMLLGLAGLPIFSEGGGLWYVFKPSFGYIIGFCLGTYVTGRIAEHLKKKTIFLLPARKPGWTYDRLCLRHDLLLCDLQLCDRHTNRNLAAHPLLLPSCSTW